MDSTIADAGFQRYLSIISLSLAGVLTLFVLNWAIDGSWMLAKGQHLFPVAAKFLPVPFIFMLWVRLMERTKPFVLSFSLVCCILAIEGFTAMQELVGLPALRLAALTLGVIASLFILVPFRDCLRRVRAQPWPALIAVIGASEAFNYYWLQDTLWVKICGWVAQLVYSFLHLWGMDITYNAGDYNFILSSPDFRIKIYADCSGLEGIFLFNFMLSAIFLLDWDIFTKRRILFYYLLGIIYMFFINILRISAYFVFGYWAYKPDAWGLLQVTRGAPLYLFHTYVGWILYLIAFQIFALCLYRTGASKPHR